jgi:hypothetical protein
MENVARTLGIHINKKKQKTKCMIVEEKKTLKQKKKKDTKINKLRIQKS